MLSRIVKGDERAFAAIFRQWSGRLAGYMYRITESQALAEEIVQDVFMKIWTNRETLEGIRDFKAFLLVVSRNHAYMALRSAMREEKHRKTWETEAAKDGGESAEVQAYYSVLDEAIEQLPARRKEVYLLSRHSRLTYEEIASSLGISRESVKTHIKLATGSIITYMKSRFPELTMVATVVLKNFF